LIRKAITSILFYSISFVLILVVIEFVAQTNEEYYVSLLGQIKNHVLNGEESMARWMKEHD